MLCLQTYSSINPAFISSLSIPFTFVMCYSTSFNLFPTECFTFLSYTLVSFVCDLMLQSHVGIPFYDLVGISSWDLMMGPYTNANVPVMSMLGSDLIHTRMSR
jgi:hypothetical protein